MTNISYQVMSVKTIYFLCTTTNTNYVVQLQIVLYEMRDWPLRNAEH